MNLIAYFSLPLAIRLPNKLVHWNNRFDASGNEAKCHVTPLHYCLLIFRHDYSQLYIYEFLNNAIYLIFKLHICCKLRIIFCLQNWCLK